ncbi:hypothetical protein E4T42_00610 [Aureobasidium subglaciale]|nr:hypothetical protein E4T42_00610 [Aureobasidium subglaciale]
MSTPRITSPQSEPLQRPCPELLRYYLMAHANENPDTSPLCLVFRFLADLPRSRFPEDLVLACLNTLLPKTELQLQHWFEPDSKPDDWAITFPELYLLSRRNDVNKRYLVGSQPRHLKLTWKEFRESHVAKVYMRHTNTVTLATRMKSPSYMYVIAKFYPSSIGKPSVKFETDYYGFENAYCRLDVEYIKMRVERILLVWKEVWKPTKMTFDVIETMAEDLRKMNEELIQPCLLENLESESGTPEGMLD